MAGIKPGIFKQRKKKLNISLPTGKKGTYSSQVLTQHSLLKI